MYKRQQLGLVALVLLISTLACTPAQEALGWTWPARIRRTLGLFAFFYACLHFVTYVALDQGLAWAALIQDVLKRNFILVGLLALVLMAPLAATSTQGMVRRLGFAKWKRLHRLAYASAVLGVIHFLWRVKKDRTQPAIYGAILLSLLAFRVWSALRKARETNSANLA